MTVSELLNILKDLDGSLEVMASRYSGLIDQEPPKVIEIFMGSYGWEKFYPKQWNGKTAPETKNVLWFEGN